MRIPGNPKGVTTGSPTTIIETAHKGGGRDSGRRTEGPRNCADLASRFGAIHACTKLQTYQDHADDEDGPLSGGGRETFCRKNKFGRLRVEGERRQGKILKIRPQRGGAVNEHETDSGRFTRKPRRLREIGYSLMPFQAMISRSCKKGKTCTCCGVRENTRRHWREIAHHLRRGLLGPRLRIVRSLVTRELVRGGKEGGCSLI